MLNIKKVGLTKVGETFVVCIIKNKILLFAFCISSFVSQQFCATAVDCLNPLLSNKSLCGVKFEYVRAVGQGRRRHFDAFVTECFVFLPVRPRVSDFRGPTHADRGLGGPTRPRGGLGTFEQV